MLNLTLLAPDFLEARFRFAGQTLTKYGAEQRRAMLLGMATTYFIARVANKVLNDDYHWEFENAFRLVYKGRAYGMRTVFGDMLHLATDFGRFWYWRLNPLTGRTVLERFTNRDAFGRKRDLVEQLADFLTTPRPIWSRSDRERKLWENFMQAMGITVSSYTDIDRMMRMASDWNKKQGKPERGEFIYDPDKDPLRTLKVALKNKDDATAVKEINRLIDSGTATGKYLDEYFKNYSNRPFTGGKQKENQFIQSLSADDRKLYWRAWEAKQEIGKGYGDAVAKALQLNPNLQDKPDAKLRPPRKTRTRGATYGVGPSH